MWFVILGFRKKVALTEHLLHIIFQPRLAKQVKQTWHIVIGMSPTLTAPINSVLMLRFVARKKHRPNCGVLTKKLPDDQSDPNVRWLITATVIIWSVSCSWCTFLNESARSNGRTRTGGQTWVRPTDRFLGHRIKLLRRAPHLHSSLFFLGVSTGLQP